MSPAKTGTPSIKKAYNLTFKSCRDNPRLLIPFFIFAGFEFAALLILYLAPRAPLRIILGPPIRTFWSERFLHYPANFFLLPKLASLSRMALSILLGSVLTAMAIYLILDAYNKKRLNLKSAFVSALKKYIDFFLVVFTFTALFYIFTKLVFLGLVKYFYAGHTKLLFLNQSLWFGPILFALNFLLALFIQSAFIYAIPILVMEKEKFFRAVIKSFVAFKNLFFPTLILVGLPMLLYIPLIVMQANTAILINKLFPEFILFILFIGIFISSLIIDPLITVASTFLYLDYREIKSGTVPLGS